MSSTEVAVTGQRMSGSALVLDPEQNFFTEHQTRALAHLGVKDATNGDLAVFFHQCLRTGLDPFARQIYMIGRKDSSAPNGVKQTIQTGIDGFRLIARRAADRTGETLSYDDAEWCGADGVWRDVWTGDGHPFAARVRVYRNSERFPATAHWSEFVQTKYDGGVTAMWVRMGCNQLAKCAEAQALRKAFPQDLSGIYTDDEMAMHDQSTERRSRRERPAATVSVTDILGEVVATIEEDDPEANPEPAS